MSDLKPCPFCGGEAELCYGPGLGTDSCRGYTLYAGCNECGAKSPGLWQEKKPEPSDPIWKDTADEWNSRPGEIDATKCGVGYCEHHREGLPVCVECREESTLAHDKACALLAEARAGIENLQWQINNEKAKAEAALALNDRALELVDEARADANHWKSECNALQRMVHEARAEIKMKNEELDMFLAEQQAMGEIIERKDKLIEQAQTLLNAVVAGDCYIACIDVDGKNWFDVRDALAAERGE